MDTAREVDNCRRPQTVERRDRRTCVRQAGRPIPGPVSFNQGI